MRYITTMDGDIFGVYYTAGDEVDTTNWTRKLLLEGLAVGVLTSTDISPTALIDMLRTRGKSVRLENTATTVTIVVHPSMADLEDVNHVGLVTGMTLTYHAPSKTWQPSGPRPWPRVNELADVYAPGDPADGQTIVWSTVDSQFHYGAATGGGGGGGAAGVWVSTTPPPSPAVGALWYDLSS